MIDIYFEAYEYMIMFMGIIMSISLLQIHWLLSLILCISIILWLIYAPRCGSGICGMVVYNSRYDGWKGEHWCKSGDIRRL